MYRWETGEAAIQTGSVTKTTFKRDQSRNILTPSHPQRISFYKIQSELSCQLGFYRLLCCNVATKCSQFQTSILDFLQPPPNFLSTGCSFSMNGPEKPKLASFTQISHPGCTAFPTKFGIQTMGIFRHKIVSNTKFLMQLQTAEFSKPERQEEILRNTVFTD